MEPLFPPALTAFLDQEGRIRHLPAKRQKQLPLLAYLADKFSCGQDYTEKEVNAICLRWSVDGDVERLRRDLIGARFLCRERDGSRYWKPEAQHDPV